VDDSHWAEVISGYMALYSALTRAMNWSALSAGAAWVVAGLAASGAASFLQAASESTATPTAAARTK